METPATEDQVNVPPADEATIASLVAGNGDGRRTFLRIAWSLGGLATICLVLALIKPLLWPPSLEEQAAHIVNLPADAHVVKLIRPSNDETGEVWFTLVEPKGLGTRQSEIWGMSAFPLPPTKAPATAVPAVSSTKSRPAVKKPGPKAVVFPTYSIDYGPYKQSLSFDAKTRQYHFKLAHKP